MKFTYRNFKNMVPEDKVLIKDYFKFKIGKLDLVLSAYEEVIKVKTDALGREYTRDPYMIPLFTIDLLMDSIENLIDGRITKIEGVGDGIYVAIELKDNMGSKNLKGYAMDHDFFSGLFHIFLKLLREKKG